MLLNLHSQRHRNNDTASNQLSGLLTPYISRSPLPSPSGTDFQGNSTMLDAPQKFSFRRNVKIVIIACLFIGIAVCLIMVYETSQLVHYDS